MILMSLGDRLACCARFVTRLTTASNRFRRADSELLVSDIFGPPFESKSDGKPLDQAWSNLHSRTRERFEHLPKRSANLTYSESKPSKRRLIPLAYGLLYSSLPPTLMK